MIFNTKNYSLPLQTSLHLHLSGLLDVTLTDLPPSSLPLHSYTLHSLIRNDPITSNMPTSSLLPYHHVTSLCSHTYFYLTRSWILHRFPTHEPTLYNLNSIYLSYYSQTLSSSPLSSSISGSFLLHFLLISYLHLLISRNISTETWSQLIPLHHILLDDFISYRYQCTYIPCLSWIIP